MAKKHLSPFSEAHKLSKTSTLLESVYNLLEWDQETYMPKDAIEYRSEQIELMASIVHKNRISPSFKKALSKLINLETGDILDTSLSEQESACVKEWRRDYNQAVKLPSSFVKQFAKTTSKSLQAWSEARKENNFKAFAPHLEKVVSLNKKKAEYLGYKDHPYDALLDLYEPGMTTAYLTPLFARLKTSLTELLRKIEAKPKHPRDFITDKPYAKEGQIRFGKLLLTSMGFTEGMSRLDISSHPFCNSLNPKDVRMTTRIIPTLPLSNIFSVVHEGGHGIYEAQLNETMYGSPLCSSISLGVHESQSRFWETLVGRSLPFWKHFYPLLQKEFPEQLGNTPFEEFYLAVNYVEPSLIRVEADEVTYCLHVIIRFELEKALIEGSLKVKDLPKAWNAKMKESLNITPSSDAEGCLQDIHWSMGSLGYFPTYALGNVYAAQFFACFEKSHPNWEEKVAKGDLLFIREWLKENLHKYGRQYSPLEMIKKITGQEVEEKFYVQYLENKYKKLYNL